jgi:hypothetical protein
MDSQDSTSVGHTRIILQLSHYFRHSSLMCICALAPTCPVFREARVPGNRCRHSGVARSILNVVTRSLLNGKSEIHEDLLYNMRVVRTKVDMERTMASTFSRTSVSASGNDDTRYRADDDEDEINLARQQGRLAMSVRGWSRVDSG